MALKRQIGCVLHTIVRHTLLIINAVFILCYVMGLLGTIIPPGQFVLCSYFGLLFPFWIVGNLFFIVFWGLRRRKYAFMSLLLLLVSFRACNNTITLPLARNTNPDSTQVSLLTYNISCYAGDSEFTRITRYLLEQDADIVCLQEFGFYKNGKTRQDKIFKKMGKQYPYRHVWYKNQQGSRWWGVATFSKFPIVNKKKIEYTSDYNISVYSDIVVRGDTLRVINNHLESNRLTMRDVRNYENLSKVPNSQALKAVTKKFSAKFGQAYRIRARQARIVADVIDLSPYKVVVCGDFNDVPQSYAYHTIRRQRDGLRDVRIALHWFYAYTYNRYGMYACIDHVLIDRCFIPTTYRIDHVPYSDHYPVFVAWK